MPKHAQQHGVDGVDGVVKALDVVKHSAQVCSLQDIGVRAYTVVDVVVRVQEAATQRASLSDAPAIPGRDSELAAHSFKDGQRKHNSIARIDNAKFVFFRAPDRDKEVRLQELLRVAKVTILRVAGKDH
jgi:hypothetical protein